MAEAGKAEKPRTPKPAGREFAPRAAAPRVPAMAATPLGGLVRMIHESPVMQARAAALRAAFGPALDPLPPVQRVAAPDRTGLPDGLKAGVEARSGLSMDDVRVHRNSPEPARVQALAYAQGTDIHLAPGQEQRLPHEAWHIVQQKQGRVAPTLQVNGVAINDDPALEREADRNGAEAAAQRRADPAASADRASGRAAPVVQRKVGFEFETGIPVKSKDLIGNGYSNLGYQQAIFDANGGAWKVSADSGAMEFVTRPFNENAGGRVQLDAAMTEMVAWAGGIPAAVAAAGNPGTARVDSVDETVGTTANLGAGPFLRPLTIRLNALTDAQILSAPQATGGVRLDQITALVDRMTTTRINAAAPQAVGLNVHAVVATPNAGLTPATVAIKNKLLAYQGQTGVAPQNFPDSLVGMNINDAVDLFGAKEGAVHAVDLRRGMLPQPRPDFDKLKGFLTLVASYLLMGAHQTAVWDYSKIIAPLMARTNFYTLYRLLDADERAQFTAALALEAAGLAGAGGARIFAVGFRHDGAIERGPTRAAWIDSIIRGSPGALFGRNPTDLMSQGSGSTASENSTGLGSMAQPDQRVTGQRDLAVLELRRLPQEVQRLEWRQMALDVFDLIVALP
ncbi:MAG: DUF4157 domain-containing protein [Roseiarcus sp.]|jgi:hypothetical protein